MDKNTESNNIKLVSKYWKKKILNREEILGGYKKQNSLPSLIISANELNYFNSLTNKNPIARYTVISAIYSFLLKKLINEFDGYVVSYYKDQCNSLLLSFPIDLNISFKEYLQKVKHEILETLKRSDYNNDLTSKKLDINDLSILSSYSINMNSDSKLDCNGVLFDITINEKEDIEIHASYLEGFIKNVIVERLVQYFKHFIVSLENNIAFNLSEYQLLSEKEKHQLLVDFNATDAAYPKGKTIVDLFEEQVEKTPNNIAVIFEESKLTYKELNEKANQLARYVSSEHTINKGDIIGVFLPKSDNGIVSLLVILKLGAVYLPIDTNYPQERINFLIKESGLKLLISDNAVLDNDNYETIALKLINFDANSKDNINRDISSKDLAYVIYTSGSTGQPKGVMVEHTSNINMSLDQIRSFEITERDKVVWFASVAFDASISEIMMSLFSGAALCIPTEETIKNKDQFVSFLKVTESTVVTFPPSYLGLLSKKDISGLRCIITAGESANSSKAIAVVEAGIDYYNAYGPTECAVCVSVYKVVKDDFDKSIIPIGRPISNTQVYILDEVLQPLPIGVAGKLFVSGAGVARGYLKKSELTEEKFITNPFDATSLLYETGDVGKWNDDGEIKFLGRNGNQVKIRGYKIELGDIESQLNQVFGIKESVVIAKKGEQQEAFLVAYILKSEDVIDTEKIISTLKMNLPYYMIPNTIIPLEVFPLTPNQKIDRKFLSQRAIQQDINYDDFKAPITNLEKKLSAFWNEVLNSKEPISVNDNFFVLGGHSLNAVKLIGLIAKQLSFTINLKTIFDYPTIELLASYLQELKTSQSIAISLSESKGFYGLTPPQYNIWLASQQRSGSIAYNMSAGYSVEGIVNLDKITRSINEIIFKYEILRTNFIEIDGIPYQKIIAAEKVRFEIGLHQLKNDTIEKVVNRLVNTAFDLETDLLIRVQLLQLETNQFILLFSTHHIIMDGLSLEIFIKEFIKNYNESTSLDVPKENTLKFQFKDYSEWFNKTLDDNVVKNELFWKNYLQNYRPKDSFDRDFSIEHNQQRGSKYLFELTPDTTLALKKIALAEQVTFYTILATALNVLIYKFSNHNDICIGTVISGRNIPELNNQIGMFVKTLVLRTQIGSEQTFVGILRNTQNNLLEINDYQAVPFEKLSQSIFDVMLAYQNPEFSFDNIDELNDFKLTTYLIGNLYSRMPIVFNLFESDNRLKGIIDYNCDLFEEDTIQIIALKYSKLLNEIIKDPLMKVDLIDAKLEFEKNTAFDFDFNF